MVWESWDEVKERGTDSGLQFGTTKINLKYNFEIKKGIRTFAGQNKESVGFSSLYWSVSTENELRIQDG